MKKLLILGTVFALFTTAASAQKIKDDVRQPRIERSFDKKDGINKGEKSDFKRDGIHRKHAHRHGMRKGKMSSRAKKYHMKKHQRQGSFRFKHNGRKNRS